MKAVGIAGMAWVTPLGADLATVWQRVTAGEVPEPKALTNPETGAVHQYLAVPPKIVDHLGRNPRLRRSSAISYYAVAAGLAALENAGLTLDHADVERMAVVFAVSDGGVIYTRKFYDQIVKQGANAASPLLFPETVYNAPASHLAAQLGIDGATYTLVGDNSVGLAALKFAEQLLDFGTADKALVVGAEECDWILCEAYRSWRLARRPLSEGAAALLLTRTGKLQIRTSLGYPFRERKGAGVALDRAVGEVLGDDDVDFVVAGANGTFIDGIEAAILQQRCRAARVCPVKRSLGEAPGASALWQVIAGSQAVCSGAATAAMVPVLGFNQQASAARIARTA